MTIQETSDQMVVEIRKLEKNDIPDILELGKKFLPSHKKLTQEEVEKIYKKTQDGCWVAEEDNKIISFVLSDLDGEQCIVKFACIVPERMGESILAKLFEAVVNQTKCRTITKI